MQHTDNAEKVRFGAWFRRLVPPADSQRPNRYSRQQKLLCIGLSILTVIIIVLLFLPSRAESVRTETYKKASGAAGLQAVITYDVACKQKPCSSKPNFDFNVYIFAENGQQVNVVRPDKDGKVNVALTEGKYVMLIGKQFGKGKLFPQEAVSLKNGSILELKLHYK